MVNLVQIKKPKYSLGTALKSDVMNKAGRWLNRQLRDSKPVQFLEAYPVPAVDFLICIFPEEHRIKIHGRTEFVIGVKAVVDQIMREGRLQQLGRLLTCLVLP